MATENEEVKIIDRVEIEPSEDDELVEGQEKDTQEESSPLETDGEAEAEPAEETDAEETAEETDGEAVIEPKKVTGTIDTSTLDAGGNLKRLADETDREFAQRKEIKRLRDHGKEERKGEFFNPGEAKVIKTDAKPDVLKKYKPEDLETFKELADAMGYARKDEIGATTYAEKSQEVLNTFLEKHPEYLPENDLDGTLWDQFKQESQLFAKPNNPKDWGKILERTHQAVFNIQPVAKLPTTTAAKEKIKVASHKTGAPRTDGIVRKSSSGVDLSMLRGFSQEELDEIGG